MCVCVCVCVYVCVCVFVKRCLPHLGKNVGEVCKNKLLTIGPACEGVRLEIYIKRICHVD